MVYQENYKPSLRELLEAFPDEIEKIAPREIRRIKKELKPYEDYFIELYKKPYDDFTKRFISEVVRVCYMPHRKLKLLSKLKQLRRMQKNKNKPGQINDADILRAKEYPITSLIECKAKGPKAWACCPFHTEKTASFCVNKNNTAKCFSCGFFGDSIQVVQKMHKMSFIDAVRYLNNL